MALSRVVACWANDASEGDASDARVARAALLSQLSSRAEDLFRRRLVKVDVSEIPSALARFRVRPIPRPLARPRPVTPATRRIDVCRHRFSSFRVLSAKNRVLRRARSVVFPPRALLAFTLRCRPAGLLVELLQSNCQSASTTSNRPNPRLSSRDLAIATRGRHAHRMRAASFVIRGRTSLSLVQRIRRKGPLDAAATTNPRVPDSISRIHLLSRALRLNSR